GDATPADAGAGSVLFSSQLAANGGQWDESTPLPGARVTFGAELVGPSGGLGDSLGAELRFPGDASLGPNERADPDLATGLETRQFFRFGTYRARVQFPTCGPNEEIASAVFLYFSDGRDGNANGIVDAPELDLHVLCGAPSFIVLTAWSDYEKSAAGVETFRKRAHAVDTATGDVFDTPAPDALAFSKTGNAPELVHAGFPAAGTFYDVGIERGPAHVRFFIVLDGVERTLWDLTDGAFVPQVPMPLMLNLWHPPTHWVPARDPANYPASDGVMRVDWVEWRAP
ncbi:MAG: cellulose-binding, family, partial [Myxococcales bacterium]|nr:cellulose-binding, family [Myxococcales bacterium]